MPLLFMKLISLIASVLPHLKKLSWLKTALPQLMKIVKLALKNWKFLLTLTSGLVFGFLANYWMGYGRTNTEIQTVTEYVTVKEIVEITPEYNCPYSLLRKPKTNGELLIEYKKLIEWRASCLNSMR